MSAYHKVWRRLVARVYVRTGTDYEQPLGRPRITEISERGLSCIDIRTMHLAHRRTSVWRKSSVAKTGLASSDEISQVSCHLSAFSPMIILQCSRVQYDPFITA